MVSRFRDERLKRGITDSFIRFSVGLGSGEDLLTDFTAALAASRGAEECPGGDHGFF